MKKGQAMLEYILSFAALLVIAAILWGLVRTSWRYAERTENLISADCP